MSWTIFGAALSLYRSESGVKYDSWEIGESSGREFNDRISSPKATRESPTLQLIYQYLSLNTLGTSPALVQPLVRRSYFMRYRSKSRGGFSALVRTPSWRSISMSPRRSAAHSPCNSHLALAVPNKIYLFLERWCAALFPARHSSTPVHTTPKPRQWSGIASVRKKEKRRENDIDQARYQFLEPKNRTRLVS